MRGRDLVGDKGPDALTQVEGSVEGEQRFGQVTLGTGGTGQSQPELPIVTVGLGQATQEGQGTGVIRRLMER